jgi:N-acetylglutamate synthase-like GNAT family acetyltransferase
MEITFQWMKEFDEESAKVYIQSLSTLIGQTGSQKLVDIARIYEPQDWFRLLTATNNGDIVGMLALYYEPIHGSHEGWICVHPEYRQYGIGDQIMDEFEKTAFENGIRIFRADATLAYTHSQKFLHRRGYRMVGYVPVSFSFLPGQSLGGAVMVWKIFDPLLLEQWEREKTEALEWEKTRWLLDESEET